MPANRLIHEKSPYLLQHAQNPVDWYPWGGEALERARLEDKPVFLSIGYAACHWCHVMAEESFEDEEVARILNDRFVSIKVDREERPDLDHLYMSVCQALTGQGGWPLSIFMTPQGEPFFAGTYFPKATRLGQPGFLDVLEEISRRWRKARGEILRSGAQIRRVLQEGARQRSTGSEMGIEVLQTAYEQLQRSFDPTWGGFGQAPKFPTPHQLTFLLRWYNRSGNPAAARLVEKTLTAMRQGGLFDHLGLGFHRYSVDARWLIPHFEKMLYDQALLALAYLEGYQALGREEFAGTAREIFSYVLRDLRAPSGLFYAAEDADSEGEEGRFYVWTQEEIRNQLGEEVGELFCRFYGIPPEGNFEKGRSVLHTPQPLPLFAAREKKNAGELEILLQQARERLFEVREKRARPFKDELAITSWNGLMIAALAQGSSILGEEDLARAAAEAADFILEKMRTPAGRLQRCFSPDGAAPPGFLEDYAFLVWGLIELYEATFQIKYLEEALNLNRVLVELFGDEEEGGFFFTGRENEALIARLKYIYDGAIPSANSVAALNLLRLSRLTGNREWEEKARQMLPAFSAEVTQFPAAYTQFLIFLDFLLGPGREIVVAGDPQAPATREMIRLIRRRFLPRKVLLLLPPGEEGKRLPPLVPFTQGMISSPQKPVVYLCEGNACKAPLKDLAELEKAL